MRRLGLGWDKHKNEIIKLERPDILYWDQDFYRRSALKKSWPQDKVSRRATCSQQAGCSSYYKKK